MKKPEIIAKVRALGLPAGSFIVYGSGPLGALGIREVNDIDLLVSDAVYAQLAARGWQQLVKGPNDTPLVSEDYEAHRTWSFSPYSPTLQELLGKAMVVDGVPFASLEDVRKWKAASGRPKDVQDIARIDEYLAHSH